MSLVMFFTEVQFALHVQHAGRRVNDARKPDGEQRDDEVT